jgi:hypothetical protein
LRLQISDLDFKKACARLAIVHYDIDIALSLLLVPTVGGDLLNKVWRVLRRESCSGKLPPFGANLVEHDLSSPSGGGIRGPHWRGGLLI